MESIYQTEKLDHHNETFCPNQNYSMQYTECSNEKYPPGFSCWFRIGSRNTRKGQIRSQEGHILDISFNLRLEPLSQGVPQFLKFK